MLTRRYFFYLGAAGLAFAAGSPAPRGAHAATRSREVVHSDEEWRQLLTPEQYKVLREAGTERPFTSALREEHRTGTYSCRGCNPTTVALFSSRTKFDSATGWPSFWAPLNNAVEETEDHSFDIDRTAISCRSCGGHLGHVFNDGPTPTGLRYCMNGIALNFALATPGSS